MAWSDLAGTRRPLSLSLIPGRIIMKKPDLHMLAQWLDPAIVAALET